MAANNAWKERARDSSSGSCNPEHRGAAYSAQSGIVPFHDPCPAPVTRAPTIFVADGDDDFRTALRGAFAAHGYEMTEASGGAEALDQLASAADGQDAWPDVLILDARMPGFSGLGILSLLSEMPDRPPTILVTGLADRSLEKVAAKLGARRVLRKPFDFDALLAAILDAVGEPRRPAST